ncbi:MAG: hypothetical protein ACRDGS_00120, partial [Chloroflexota bacterium]
PHPSSERRLPRRQAKVGEASRWRLGPRRQAKLDGVSRQGLGPRRQAGPAGWSATFLRSSA